MQCKAQKMHHISKYLDYIVQDLKFWIPMTKEEIVKSPREVRKKDYLKKQI